MANKKSSDDSKDAKTETPAPKNNRDAAGVTWSSDPPQYDKKGVKQKWLN